MPSKIIPEGFKDDVSSQVATEHHFKNLIIKHFQLNGFKLVKTPLIEFCEQDTEKNVFKIEANKKEKKLYIRDDITLQVARLSETRLYKKHKPLKLCYYGEVLRKKGTMLRPERQFLQIGAECIGEKNYLADVEMMELAATSLELVGIKNITIEVSSRIFFDKFLSMIKKNTNKNKIKDLMKLKNLEAILKLVEKSHHKYLKDLFACTGNYKYKKNNLEKVAIDEYTSNEITNITNIIKIFSKRNKKINIFLDFCEIDNKNYHSGIRFTFFAHDVRGEIASGGRYFIKDSNIKNVATGFTCYMDSILRASSLKFIEKKILVPFNLSKNKLNELIENGFLIIKYTGDLIVSKKIAKDQNCQFYLEKNLVKKI